MDWNNRYWIGMIYIQHVSFFLRVLCALPLNKYELNSAHADGGPRLLRVWNPHIFVTWGLMPSFGTVYTVSTNKILGVDTVSTNKL